jgi:hypothetical protein
MASRTVVCGLLLLGLSRAATAQVVDHRHVDGVTALPQSVMDTIGQQRWLFAHASVGGNMIQGMDALNAANSTRYQLVTSWVNYLGAEMRVEPPPATPVPGTVYETNRGNPGWADKLTIFDNSVRISGWRAPTVDAVMDKMCYIDQDAVAADYISSMAALQSSYPSTAFVYTTMPLTTGEDSTNVLRNQYNAAVRSHCASGGWLLFDIADMEAYDPTGVQHTFPYGGLTYQKLYAGYTSDGGHLGSAGQARIAQGWYAMAAVLATDPIFADGFQ